MYVNHLAIVLFLWRFEINIALHNNFFISDNSDLIACTVVWKDGQKIRRFLVIDIMQLILVEPDTKKLGWGVAKLVGFLQDIEVSGDKDDSRCLHITIQRPLSSGSSSRIPLLSAKFVFDDNIRCMAAKQRLTKGRIKARQKKMQHIARLLDIPGQTGPPSPAYVGGGSYMSRGIGRISRDNRPLFHTGRVPGFAAPHRENLPGIIHRTDGTRRKSTDSPIRTSHTSENNNTKLERNRSRESSCNRLKSREGSPRMPRPRSEEIPLELIKKPPNAVSDISAKITILPRPQTPRDEMEPSTSADEFKVPPETVEAKNSEETSFMAEEENITQRKKGVIETV